MVHLGGHLDVDVLSYVECIVICYFRESSD